MRGCQNVAYQMPHKNYSGNLSKSPQKIIIIPIFYSVNHTSHPRLSHANSIFDEFASHENRLSLWLLNTLNIDLRLRSQSRHSYSRMYYPQYVNSTIIKFKKMYVSTWNHKTNIEYVNMDLVLGLFAAHTMPAFASLPIRKDDLCDLDQMGSDLWMNSDLSHMNYEFKRFPSQVKYSFSRRKFLGAYSLRGFQSAVEFFNRVWIVRAIERLFYVGCRHILN